MCVGECFIFHFRTSIRFPWHLWQQEERQNRCSGCWRELGMRGAAGLAATPRGQLCPSLAAGNGVQDGGRTPLLGTQRRISWRKQQED